MTKNSRIFVSLNVSYEFVSIFMFVLVTKKNLHVCVIILKKKVKTNKQTIQHATFNQAPKSLLLLLKESKTQKFLTNSNIGFFFKTFSPTPKTDMFQIDHLCIVFTTQTYFFYSESNGANTFQSKILTNHIR